MKAQASSTRSRAHPARDEVRRVPPCRSTSRGRAAPGGAPGRPTDDARGCGLALQPGLTRALLFGLPLSIALWGVIIWLLVTLL